MMGDNMARSDYFVIGALLASLVIAAAISYICTTLDTFSEAKRDEEFRRPIGRHEGVKDGAYPGAKRTDENFTQPGEVKNKERDG
jgi:hypothetical protein